MKIWIDIDSLGGDMTYTRATEVIKEIIGDNAEYNYYDVYNLDDTEVHYFILKYPKYVRLI